MILKNILLIVLLIVYVPSVAQVYSDMLIGKNKELSDNIKIKEYPYILPILGEKAYKAGFDLPYSTGLGANYFTQKSSLLINNLKIGFNNGELFEMDEIVRFNNTSSSSTAYNIRPDIWLFPFLNLYAIFAKSKTGTNVDFSVEIPVNNINQEVKEVIAMETKAEFDAVSTGFGFTPTIGIGGGWFALDMNFIWTDIDALEKPAYSFVFGPRVGKTFRLKEAKKTISIWVGGFRLKMNTGTSGALPINELIDLKNIDSKISAGNEVIESTETNINNWWEGLTKVQQANPTNKAKFLATNKTLEIAARFLDALSNTAVNIDNSTVQYTLDKRQKSIWNFIVGIQFQLNKNWMARSEYGFLGDRKQFISGVQYRFGL